MGDWLEERETRLAGAGLRDHLRTLANISSAPRQCSTALPLRLLKSKTPDGLLEAAWRVADLKGALLAWASRCPVLGSVVSRCSHSRHMSHAQATPSRCGGGQTWVSSHPLGGRRHPAPVGGGSPVLDHLRDDRLGFLALDRIRRRGRPCTPAAARARPDVEGGLFDNACHARA